MGLCLWFVISQVFFKWYNYFTPLSETEFCRRENWGKALLSLGWGSGKIFVLWRVDLCNEDDLSIFHNNPSFPLPEPREDLWDVVSFLKINSQIWRDHQSIAPGVYHSLASYSIFNLQKLIKITFKCPSSLWLLRLYLR